LGGSGLAHGFGLRSRGSQVRILPGAPTFASLQVVATVQLSPLGRAFGGDGNRQKRL
jgi:hypothetical protein